MSELRERDLQKSDGSLCAWTSSSSSLLGRRAPGSCSSCCATAAAHPLRPRRPHRAGPLHHRRARRPADRPRASSRRPARPARPAADRRPFAFNPRRARGAGRRPRRHPRHASRSPTSSARCSAEHHEPIAIADGPDPCSTGVVELGLDAARRPPGAPLDDLAGVGIGLPGPVEHATGRPINPPIMPGWDGFDVPAHVRELFGVPVLVDNDVNLMALGEHASSGPTSTTCCSSRSPPASAPASSPTASSAAAPRAPPATSATSPVPRRRRPAVPLRQLRLPRGGRQRPGHRHALRARHRRADQRRRRRARAGR